MGEVRSLEENIASWQNQLRERVHKGQLQVYHQ